MLTKHQLYKVSRKIHKWVGLFIAIQVLFWIAGGLIMSSLPLDIVHGDHLHNKTQHHQVNINDYQIKLEEVLKQNKLNPSLVKFHQIETVPVYEIEDKKSHYYSGITGKPVTPLSKESIKRLAKGIFTGIEPINSVEKIERLPLEASRLQGPVWKIIFDDNIDTTFYMHQYTGQLLTVRSDIWRLFDFVWMLHIMDYDNRNDFNNPLLIIFAASALLFSISGFILLFQVFRYRDFMLIKNRAKKPTPQHHFGDRAA